MKYIELKVSTTHEASELVSDILSEYSTDGVAINDVQDVIDLEKSGKNWDYADGEVYDSSGTVTVTAFIGAESSKEVISEIKSRLESLKKNAPFEVGSLCTEESETDGDLWREQWKKNYKPIHIGKTVIVPEWMDYNAGRDETKVLIGSNMAFGTGEHETTAMCVAFLGKYVGHGSVVIDVGCGSGILGICAAKLGAKEVVMTDIDECAVTAAQQNVLINGVENARVSLKNLLDDESIKGDIIVCNIIAEVLIGFASGISKNLNDGGIVILSGILSDRLKKVEKAYLAAGFDFLEDKTVGEWSACVFKKRTF